MEAYQGFAKVYDQFMDQTPYDIWMNNLQMLFHKYAIPEQGEILELGCGTGKMTRRLASLGYVMTAMDNAQEMLEIAAETPQDNVVYVLQDMTSLQMTGKVDAVISICDCMNYVTKSKDLLATFERVRECLKKDGLFVFDMNSLYKYETLLGDNTFAEDREEASFIWENFYDSKTRINEYDLTLFVENEAGTYNKYEEVHMQRAYVQDEVEELLHTAGFTNIEVLDVDTMNTPRQESERLYYVAR